MEIEFRSIIELAPDAFPNTNTMNNPTQLDGSCSSDESFADNLSLKEAIEISLMARFDEKLRLGVNLFNLTQYLTDVEVDLNQGTGDILYERQWHDQILKQPHSPKFLAWFDERFALHVQYRQNLANLPHTALLAMWRHLFDLEQFGKHMEITARIKNNLHEAFFYKAYGIRAGEYFTAEEAAWCGSIRGPAGLCVQEVLRRHDIAGAYCSDKSFIFHLLIPVIKNIFFPQLILPSPLPRCAKLLLLSFERRLNLERLRVQKYEKIEVDMVSALSSPPASPVMSEEQCQTSASPESAELNPDLIKPRRMASPQKTRGLETIVIVSKLLEKNEISMDGRE